MINELIEKIITLENPSVIGIDTKASYLPCFESIKNFKQAGEEIFAFNKEIIDNIYDIVPCVKVQVAYYEMYGVWGMKAFYDTIKYAKQKGLIVISDVKRNDIMATASAYSSAYLGKSDIKGEECAFPSDFITINAYLGSDGIVPFIKDCKENNKGIFILVRTSNPSGKELQNLIVTHKNKPLYEIMGNYVSEWGKDYCGKFGYSLVGAVVGATHKEEAEKLRKANPSTFFLVPGYGAQGGKAEDLAVCFDNDGLGAVVNSSRAILCAYQNPQYKGLDFALAARQATLDMKNDILTALKQEKNIDYKKTKYKYNLV